MKKYIVPAVLVAAFGLYLAFGRGSSSTTITPSPVATTTDTPTPPVSPTSPTPTPPASKGQYKDGTYTGPVTDAYYGNLQVAAVIKAGKLADVQFLELPAGSGHTAEVSSMSAPILKQEALAAQSANVDIVSGATQTSEAFQKSLAAALAQAKS